MHDLPSDTTLHPVTFENFQQVLNSLGYGMEKLEPGSKLIHWRLNKASSQIPHNGPPLLTTGQPDFRNKNHEDLVYDRDYVIDLLTSALDGDFDKDGTTLRAILSGVHHRH